MARDERLHEIVRILSSYGLQFLYHNQVKPSRKDQVLETFAFLFEKRARAFNKTAKFFPPFLFFFPIQQPK